MNNQRSSTSAKILEFPQVEERSLAEDLIKARVWRLTNLVEDFANSTINVLDVENTLLRELLEELVVKEAALRWIVRTASHTEGPVREKLWADIDKVLTELENTAETYDFYSRRALNNPVLAGRNQIESGNDGRAAS
jgi:hypothetical protein